MEADEDGVAKGEPIEIKDVDDTLDQSDNESVVEVLEDDVNGEEPLEVRGLSLPGRSAGKHSARGLQSKVTAI